MSPARRGALVLVSILLILILFPFPAAAQTASSTLADPPQMPAHPSELWAASISTPAPPLQLAVASSGAASPSGTAFTCPTGDHCLYFPILSPLAGVLKKRTDAIDLYRAQYLGTMGVSSGWNGNVAACIPGTTSPDFQKAVLDHINYFRQMSGVPALLGLSDLYNQQDQNAALMMAANQNLSHSPPSSWKCYTEAGYTGASQSNLAMGGNGPTAINMYMNDGSVGSLGHRRWILYPQTQVMGTGDIDGSGWQTQTNALRAWDDHIWDARPATRDAFVAWPPPGYVPYPLVYNVWSFSVAGANFSNAAVSVTSNGASVPVKISQTPNGYGENTLAWTACSCSQWPNPGADRDYQVTVRGVVVNGVSTQYNYTVTVIDPAG